MGALQQVLVVFQGWWPPFLEGAGPLFVHARPGQRRRVVVVVVVRIDGVSW